MNRILPIQDNTKDRISYYHLVAFAASLPFDRLYSELILISLLLHQLFHLRFRKLRFNHGRPILWLVPVYLLTLVGTCYTKYHGEAFYEWERQLALVLFPLLFGILDPALIRYKMQVLAALTASCAVTILYLYATALSIVCKMHLPWQALFNRAFINHNFSAPIDMHATYFSMYIALAVASVLYWLRYSHSRRTRTMLVVLLLLLGAGLLQLSSKAVLLSLALILNIAAPVFLFPKRTTLRLGMAVLVVSAGFVALVTKVDSLHNRLVLQLKDDLTENSIRNNAIEPRMKRWQYALKLVKQEPVYGHGSGSEIALLKQAYFSDRLYNSYLHELNAHNQYLSIAIKTGLTGLAVFLISLIVYFRKAIGSKDFVFFSFLVICCTTAFSENILDANKGIFFFAFFLSFFFFPEQRKQPAIAG